MSTVIEPATATVPPASSQGAVSFSVTVTRAAASPGAPIGAAPWAPKPANPPSASASASAAASLSLNGSPLEVKSPPAAKRGARAAASPDKERIRDIHSPDVGVDDMPPAVMTLDHPG